MATECPQVRRRSRARVARHEQVTDHRNRRRPRIQNRCRGVQRDSAYGDDRDSLRSLRRRPHQIKTDGLAAGRFTARPEHRPYSDVAHRLTQRILDLGNGMGGETDDCLGTEQLARLAWWHVVLTHVHAGRAGHASEIDSVVDDDPRAVPVRRGDGRVAKLEEQARREPLGAKLNEGRSPVEEGVQEIERRPTGAGRNADVDDRVKRIQRAWYPSASA
jgi:hypothetical protein